MEKFKKTSLISYGSKLQYLRWYLTDRTKIPYISKLERLAVGGNGIRRIQKKVRKKKKKI